MAILLNFLKVIFESFSTGMDFIYFLLKEMENEEKEEKKEVSSGDPTTFHATKVSKIKYHFILIMYPSLQAKVKSKAGEGTQWHIMVSLGIDENEIPKFCEPLYWLNYFPKYTKVKWI